MALLSQRLLLAFLIVGALAAFRLGAEPPPAVQRLVDVKREVVILVNENVPESVQLGTYYAQRRGIPETQICRIKTTANEVMSWPELRQDILAPLKEFLTSRPEVLYIVPTYGVPVKTSEEHPENDGKGGPGGTITASVTGRDYCCIDREIELLQVEHELEGWIQSKVFRAERHLSVEDKIYLVSRLDGPTPESARALVDNALYGEAYGVEGKCLIDTRGRTTTGDGYTEIDLEMKDIVQVYKRYGFDFDHDDQEPVVDLATRENPSHYWGWYTGDIVCSKDEWRFNRGAVGAHLHSFSAGILRKKDRTWTGPLVYHGITGTCGTVYEPLASGFPYGTIFLDRFFQGYTFGEAMEMANMFTSWMAVFVGDPLYAPYAEGMKERQAKNRALAKEAYRKIAAALDAGDPVGAHEVAKEIEAVGVAYAGAEDCGFLVRETRARLAVPDKKAHGVVAELKKAVDAARAAVDASDWKKGAAEARKALALSPVNFEANLCAGMSAVAVNNAPDGLAALALAAKTETTFEVQYWSGRGLRLVGKRKEAQAAFEAALALRFDLEATRALGELLLEQGKAADAIARLETVQKQHPGDGEIAGELGKAYVAVKDWKKAITVLEAAVKDLPTAWSEFNDFVGGYELLLAAVKGEGTDKVRIQSLSDVVKDLKSGRVRPTARDQAGKIGVLVEEATAAAGAEKLGAVAAYDEKLPGLPRLRLANKYAAAISVLVSGPVSFVATVPGLEPKAKVKPLEVDLVPGVYRIAIVAVEGGKKRIFTGELRAEPTKHYAVGLDEKLKPYQPPK